MVRIVQISDTHISPTKRHFYSNWPPLKAWLAAQQPDFIVHSGDITVDAADQEEDAAHCAALLNELGVPVLAVPGNHDVGEAGNAHQPPTRERNERFRRYFGPDRWVRDVGGWRLIGFNTMLLGSGERDEAEQQVWLKAAMANADGRRIAWFTHRPLFIDDPQEGDTGYWSVKPDLRKELFKLMQEYPVGIVSTGHLHRWHDMSLDGTRYIWAPSTGFLVGSDQSPPKHGSARLGAVIYDINGTDIKAEIVPVPNLTNYWIDDVIHEVYPPRDTKA
ncbi:MAG TPA: metallophosphoesterase [Pseudorhodoplanes sp.]|jgi:alkaline phosphatase D|nr:metallophosphoesterase [Pseudorhodoplanes sp.]